MTSVEDREAATEAALAALANGSIPWLRNVRGGSLSRRKPAPPVYGPLNRPLGILQTSRRVAATVIRLGPKTVGWTMAEITSAYSEWYGNTCRGRSPARSTFRDALRYWSRSGSSFAVLQCVSKDHYVVDIARLSCRVSAALEQRTKADYPIPEPEENHDNPRYFIEWHDWRGAQEDWVALGHFSLSVEETAQLRKDYPYGPWAEQPEA